MRPFFPRKTNKLSNVIGINFKLLYTPYLAPGAHQLNMFYIIVGAQIDDGKAYIKFYINKHSQYNYQVFT